MSEPDESTTQHEVHTGGCRCGALRYRTIGQPKTAVVCHCRYCQARTGSAFGVGVFFPSQAVELTQGVPKPYAFETESGRSFVTQFCPDCGSSIFWTIGLFPDWTAVAGGSFDPPSFWFPINRQVFTRSKAPFTTCQLEHSHETSASYAPIHEDSAPLTGG